MLRPLAGAVALLAVLDGFALADEEGIVVEAGEPLPVPVDAVVDRLRTELPGVSVRAASPAAAGGATRSGGTVTLGLSPEGSGKLFVSYRDASGRETTRIVADMGDPQAMAAAIAMIVANLHQSQVDSVLAILPTPPLPSPPPVVDPLPRTPLAAAPERPSHRAGRTAPRIPRRAPVRVEDGWLSIGWAPFVSIVADFGPVVGMTIGADAALGAWRLEAALGYSPGRTVDGEYAWYWGDESPTYAEIGYTQTMGSLGARRILIDGRNARFGLGGGLGFLIEAYSYHYVSPEPAGGTPDRSSYLDAFFSASTSLDVRVLWRNLWWSSRADVAVSTATNDHAWYRPVAADLWMQLSTGVRVTL